MVAKKPRTSIIMPVYNTSEFVIQCIDSVLAQTDTDWEVIIVNDVSTDNSAEIVQNYLAELNDERFTYIDHEVNQGLSGARNTALKYAQGDWISFLDSDDSFEPQFLEQLHQLAEVSGAEIVTCAHKLISLDGEETYRAWPFPENATGKEAAVQLLFDKISPYVWDKLFRVEIIRQVRFDNKVHRAEDALYTFQTLARAAKFASIKTPLYRYQVDPKSLTWGNMVEVTESDHLVAAFNGFAQELVQGTPNLAAALSSAKVLTYVNNSQQAMVAGKERAALTIKECRKRLSWADIFRIVKFKPALAVAATALMLAPGLYRKVYYRYISRKYGIKA